MARRPTKKQLERANKIYVETLTPVLLELGCVPTGRGFPQYTLETRAGRLNVSVSANVSDFGAAVYTKFDDVEAAVKLLGGNDFYHQPNPHTGKWNHHFFGVPVEDAAHALRREFAKVTATDPDIELMIANYVRRARRLSYSDEVIAKRVEHIREAIRLTREGKPYTFDPENGCKEIDAEKSSP